MYREKLCRYIRQMPLSDEIERSLTALVGEVAITGEEDIALDEADIMRVLKCGDRVFVGSGRHRGEDAPIYAMQAAIENASFDKFTGKIGGALIHFRIHPDISMVMLGTAMERIEQYIDEDAPIIFGAKFDESISKNDVEATVLLACT